MCVVHGAASLRDESSRTVTNASRVSVEPLREGWASESETVSRISSPLQGLAPVYPPLRDSGESENHAAPQPQWPVDVDVATSQGRKEGESENRNDET